MLCSDWKDHLIARSYFAAFGQYFHKKTYIMKTNGQLGLIIQMGTFAPPLESFFWRQIFKYSARDISPWPVLVSNDISLPMLNPRHHHCSCQCHHRCCCYCHLHCCYLGINLLTRRFWQSALPSCPLLTTACVTRCLWSRRSRSRRNSRRSIRSISRSSCRSVV